jgi:hypothetical protein
MSALPTPNSPLVPQTAKSPFQLSTGQTPAAPAITPADSLIVRQFERVRCALPAESSITTEHSKTVVLSAMAADGNGTFPVTVVDISKGGLGLKSTVFIPKLARLSVIIADPQGREAATLVNIRIQRVVMIDRTPTYELGGPFLDPTPQLASQIAALINRVGSSQPAASPAKKGDANV